MDKKRTIKNKDLLYENSVSLATAEALTLEEVILFEEKFIGKILVMMMSLLIRRGVELTDEREKRTRNQVLLYVWRLCPWGPDFWFIGDLRWRLLWFFGRPLYTRIYMGRGNCQNWWHVRIWRVFGALTEDSQHFSWEGMMRCMTVGLWPSGIFFMLRFCSLAIHSLIHYCLVTRT